MISVGQIDERGYIDGMHVRRQADTVSAGVVSAARRKQQQNRHPSQNLPASRSRSHYCTVPRGRAAIMLSAHSAAVSAEIRRLSEAAQIQNPFAFCESGRAYTCICSWPAAFTLLGDSSPPCNTSTCSPERTAVRSSVCAGCSSSMYSENACPWKIGACRSISEGTTTLSLTRLRKWRWIRLSTDSSDGRECSP